MYADDARGGGGEVSGPIIKSTRRVLREIIDKRDGGWRWLTENGLLVASMRPYMHTYSLVPPHAWYGTPRDHEALGAGRPIPVHEDWRERHPLAAEVLA